MQQHELQLLQCTPDGPLHVGLKREVLCMLRKRKKQQRKNAMQLHRSNASIACVCLIRQDRLEVHAMASEILSAGDALTDLLAERLGHGPLGPLGCLALSGVSEYLLLKTRNQTMVHGARALNGLSGVAPSRELMDLSGTMQCADVASGP